MILVETNVLSELTKPKPEDRVVTWLEVNEPALAVPTIALAELRYGIARLPRSRRRSSLLRFWRATCDQFRGRIFSFDERAAETYGEVAAAAERAGRRLNVQDGQIAAIALVHRMQVATRNAGHFEATGAVVVNPWE